MTQHDYVIANQSFPSTRTDLNNVLQAIVSNNSGTSAPSTTFANQLFYNSSTNVLSIRNEDNDAFIPLMQFDQSADVAATLATVIDILDASGTNTAGTALTIRGGAGTGTGAGGAIILQTANGGSSGSSVNSHATAVTIADDGKVGVGITSPEALTHIAGATADADGALGSQSPQLIIEGGNNNNPFEIGMDNSGATAIGFLQSRNKSAGAQFLALNPKGGNVSIGNTTPEATLDVTGNSDSVAALKLNGGNTTHGFHFFTRNTDGDLSVTREVSGTQTECLKIQRSSGMLTAIGVYNITTSGAANVNVQSSGAVLRSTSSEKYKQNIEDMELSYAQAILNLRPVYYKSKCDQDNADDSHWGFIAEEVEKIDPRLVLYKTLNVTFNDEGMPVEEVLKTPEPEGVQYDRLTPAIVKLLQEQQKTIEALEARVKTLEG